MKQNLKHTALSIACLTGLVSCIPPVPLNPNAPALKPSGLKTPAELEAAAQKKEKAMNAEKNALQQSKDRLEREERERINERRRLENERKEAASYRNKTPNDKAISKTTRPKVPALVKPKISKPNVTLVAKPVPGRSGFVFNPHTKNQVDVRGIPSGSKVRDPADGSDDPALIFRVP